MIVQTDSRWITYALIGAVLLGALLYDKANSMAAPITHPTLQPSPTPIALDAEWVPIPLVSTSRSAQRIVTTPTPSVTVPVAPTPSVTIPVVPTPMPQYITHVVRRGETLYSIAIQYNTTIERIMTENRLTGYTIFAGQQLVIRR